MRRKMRVWGPLIVASLVVTVHAQEAQEEKAEVILDPLTGMKMAPGWEAVRNNCIACHSPRQFLRQKGTITTWTEILRWMQKSGGLWPLEEETEETILRYLTDNYGPSDEYRRAPIPATLMPPNPYRSEVREVYEEKKKAGLIPERP